MLNVKVPKNILIFIVVFIIIFLVGLFYFLKDKKIKSIDSFDECKNAGYAVLESFPEQCKTPDGRTFVRQIEQQEITITGEFVCLPHKNKEGPQTLECAFGLKDENGSHYGLSDKDFKYTSNLATGTKVTVVGIYKPDTDSKYDILGNIEVENLIKK